MKKWIMTLMVIMILMVMSVDFFGTSVVSEFRITTDESLLGDPWFDGSPAIYGNIVVWVDWRNGNADIYGFNLSTKEEFQITTNPGHQFSPAIHGTIVLQYGKTTEMATHLF